MKKFILYALSIAITLIGLIFWDLSSRLEIGSLGYFACIVVATVFLTIPAVKYWHRYLKMIFEIDNDDKA